MQNSFDILRVRPDNRASRATRDDVTEERNLRLSDHKLLLLEAKVLGIESVQSLSESRIVDLSSGSPDEDIIRIGVYPFQS